jgi:hypothetical protein
MTHPTVPDRLPQLLDDHRTRIFSAKEKLQSLAEGNEKEFKVAVDKMLSDLAKDTWCMYMEHRARQRIGEELSRPAPSEFAKRALLEEPASNGERLLDESGMQRILKNSHRPGTPPLVNYTGHLCARMESAGTGEGHVLNVWFHGGGDLPGNAESATVKIRGGEVQSAAEFRIMVDAEKADAAPDNSIIQAPITGESKIEEFYVSPAADPQAAVWIYAFQANRMIQGLKVLRSPHGA